MREEEEERKVRFRRKLHGFDEDDEDADDLIEEGLESLDDGDTKEHT